jgi:hypothetical protein
MGKILKGVGTAVTSGADSDLAKRLEAAEAQAIRDAMAAGVSLSDGKEILEWKRKAREKVLAGQ